jgi:hypothetical protein
LPPAGARRGRAIGSPRARRPRRGGQLQHKIGALWSVTVTTPAGRATVAGPH